MAECKKAERLIIFRKSIKIGHYDWKAEGEEEVIGLELCSIACVLIQNFPLCVDSPRNIHSSYPFLIGKFSPHAFLAFQQCHSHKVHVLKAL